MWMLGRVCTISTPGIKKKKKKKDLPVGMNRPFGQSSDSARFEWRPLQAHSRQQRETLESVRPTLSVVVEELEQVAAR
jgi:hypothetical protein